MQLLDTLFFYSFSCSTLLVYGLGLEKSFLGSRPGMPFLSRFPAVVLELLLSVVSLWFVQSSMLVPAGMYYLMPITVVLICGISHLLSVLIFPSLRSDNTGERLFYFGLSYLCVSEGASFVDAIIIAVAGLLSFFLLTVILFAIRARIASARVHPDIKGSPLVLISMGLLCTVLYAADASWWIQEAFK
jgi:Na+-translocating ferredoxin:NAD+ oxidoreductase RnfA subunit